MLLAMAQDLRGYMVKPAASLLHNMRTLKHLRKHNNDGLQQETLGNLCAFSIPLRISRIKGIEDTALRYSNPQPILNC